MFGYCALLSAGGLRVTSVDWGGRSTGTHVRCRGLLKDDILHGLYSAGYTDTDCTLQDIHTTQPECTQKISKLTTELNLREMRTGCISQSAALTAVRLLSSRRFCHTQCLQ